jgi:hypothetical protein
MNVVGAGGGGGGLADGYGISQSDKLIPLPLNGIGMFFQIYVRVCPRTLSVIKDALLKESVPQEILMDYH